MSLNVWVLFPTANMPRAHQAVAKWQERGYKTCLLIDWAPLPQSIQGPSATFEVVKYEGYWWAINKLMTHPSVTGGDVFVAAADDIDPDPKHTAQEIGQQFLKRFPDGFGVMQPCADMQGVDSSGKPAAARICGSPWFGRGWVQRAYQGKGPMPENYFHYYGDEEIKEVAEKLGVLWMRPDLIQDHHHWSWGRRPIGDYNIRNQEHWAKDQAMFFKRKSEGFPGSEPI